MEQAHNTSIEFARYVGRIRVTRPARSDGHGHILDRDADLERAVMGIAGRAKGIGRFVGQGVDAHSELL